MSTEKEILSTDETIFTSLPGPFPVDENGKIQTKAFLEASSGAVMIIEKFGKVFSPVVHDMKGNITKLTNKYEEDTIAFNYIEDMILKEKESGEGLIATDALQWLRRGLEFLAKFFELVIDNGQSKKVAQDLTPFVRRAYKETLATYHGWLGKQLFNILSRFAPTHSDLFYTLALEKYDMEKHVLVDLKAFNQRMKACVVKLVAFYEENDLETTYRV